MEPDNPDHPEPPRQDPARSTDFPGVLAWARRLPRLIALGAGIYVCFLILGMVSQSTDNAPRIEIDPVRADGYGFRVSGRARPFDMIEVLAGERQLAIIPTDWRGRFETQTYPPPEARGLWARVFAWKKPDVEIARTGIVAIPPAPGEQAPPRLTLAYFVEETRTLWVAGYGPPSEEIVFQAPGGERVGYAFPGPDGGFDALIALPAEREIPAALILEEVGGQEPFAVSRVKAADLPLSRTAEIEIRAQEPHLTLRLELPAAHPYFALLEQGLMPAEELVRAVFGSLSPGGLSETESFEKTGSQGVVLIEQNLIFVGQSLEWVQGRGIGEAPLLTARDRISMRFQGIKPAWFGDPPPSRFAGDSATWQGPVPARQVPEVGFHLPDLVRIYAGLRGVPQTEVQDEKFLDFIGRISGRGGAAFQSLWRELLLLIPFAGLIWLAARQPFGSRELWRALAATAAVLALWRVFGALSPWVLRFGGTFLALPLSRSPTQPLGPLVPQAFWMPFALFAAALPSLWTHLSNMEPAVAAPKARRSILRRARIGLRLVYGVGVSILYIAIAYGVLRPSDVLALRSDLELQLVERLALPVCFCLLLLTFGLRALLMGVAVVLVALRQHALADPSLQEAASELKSLASLRDGLAIAIAVLAVCPFLFLLVRRLTRAFLGRRGALALTAALVASALLLPHLPVRIMLAAAGALLLFGFGGIVLRLLRGSGLSRPWVRALASRPRAAQGALLLAALLLAWPLTGADAATRLESGQVQILNTQIQDLFVYVLALGLVLLLRDYARRSPSPVVERATLATGIYLFSVLLINSYSPWLLLPVPFLVGLLLAGSWLFRPEDEVQRLRSVPADKLNKRHQLIQDVVDASAAGEQFAAIRKSLTQKLNSVELTPEEYDGKLEVYRSYLGKKLELENVSSGVSSREAVFAVGGPDLWSNVSAAVKTGAVLAAGPFLIAIYQFLPHSRVSYPFPLMTLLGFILSAAASWLLYSFFFGFYFAYLRGRSGLTKGIHLFVGLFLPFAVYRLLNAQSLTDMRSFILWATQLFLFCSLLGLFAVDYRLLRSNGFRLRDLTAVHNVPALSAYASTAVAALVPTVIALITGKFGEIVKFFLETVLGVPSGS
ncbi:MAG: hypothetical protein ACJ759_20760 [Thermoanaerobaculia bacterium]